jgi:hypothetical protein
VHAEFKPFIVRLILNRKPEQAIALLADHYGVNAPKLKVGLPKGHKRHVYGCYTPRTVTISVLNSDTLGNPFVILHEFYHHLRTHSVDKKHKGTEKNANKFATDYLQEYEISIRACKQRDFRQVHPIPSKKNEIY